MFVHGDNLTQKENHRTKYTDDKSKQFLAEIRAKYDIWKQKNVELKGPFIEKTDNDSEIIAKRVELFSEYKDFIDEQKYAEKFDSRSNLHSSVLEEFIFCLFKDLVVEFSESALIGKAHTFKDMFFQPESFSKMVCEPNVLIEKKDHDFVIGVDIYAKLHCGGSEIEQVELIQVPAVAIECKTYLDKTMLEGASTAGEQLLARNPNGMYLVVAEWLKLTEKVNLKKFKVDQIFVLRKQKNTDREFRYADDYEKNPIYSDVVEHLYHMVREHLTTSWDATIQSGIERGYLI